MKKIKLKYVIAFLMLCTFSFKALAQNEVKSGVINTGDDCDQILYSTGVWNPADGGEDRKGPPKAIGFILKGDDAGKVTWWKKMSIPVKGGGYKDIVFETSNSNSATTYIKFEDLDFTRGVTVHKAKFLGAKTKLNYTFNILKLLNGSTNQNYQTITFKWVKDKCGN